jgi:hypothetical protein
MILVFSTGGPVSQIGSGFLTGELLHLIAVLDLVDKDLGRFEAGDVMLIDDDGGIPGDVAGDFFLPLFIDETAEAPHINIMAVAHVRFHDGKERFNGVRYITFVDSGSVSDLVDDVGFGHSIMGFGVSVFSERQI